MAVILSINAYLYVSFGGPHVAQVFPHTVQFNSLLLLLLFLNNNVHSRTKTPRHSIRVGLISSLYQRYQSIKCRHGHHTADTTRTVAEIDLIELFCFVLFLARGGSDGLLSRGTPLSYRSNAPYGSSTCTNVMLPGPYELPYCNMWMYICFQLCCGRAYPIQGCVWF